MNTLLLWAILFGLPAQLEELEYEAQQGELQRQRDAEIEVLRVEMERSKRAPRPRRWIIKITIEVEEQ